MRTVPERPSPRGPAAAAEVLSRTVQLRVLRWFARREGVEGVRISMAQRSSSSFRVISSARRATDGSSGRLRGPQPADRVEPLRLAAISSVHRGAFRRTGTQSPLANECLDELPRVAFEPDERIESCHAVSISAVSSLCCCAFPKVNLRPSLRAARPPGPSGGPPAPVPDAAGPSSRRYPGPLPPPSPFRPPLGCAQRPRAAAAKPLDRLRQRHIIMTLALRCRNGTAWIPLIIRSKGGMHATPSAQLPAGHGR